MMTLDCADVRRQRAEETLTTALSEASYFAISDSALVLFTWGGDTLTFARVILR
jgi:hypothetical protein